MKRNFLLALFAATFMLWSCGDTKDKKTKDGDDTEDIGKKKKTDDDGEERSDDDMSSAQSSPENVMRTIFKAAKSGDFSTLSNLCAEDDGDGDVKKVCGLESETAKTQEEFKEYFSKGKIVGEATIDGNEASVDFKFGPDGDKDETMRMIMKGKKWYLRSF